MQVINPNHLFAFIASPFTLIPVAVLIFYYFRTRVFDFLLFALFLFAGFLTLISDPLADITNSLIFFQIHSITIDIATLLLFFHAVRVHWTKPPLKVLAIGIGWFSVLFIITSMWQIMLQPDQGMLLFWEVPRAHSTYFPKGAGLMLDNGVIIFATSYRLIGDIFTVLTIFFLLYTYYSIQLVLPTDRIIRARKLWMLVWSLLLIQTILRLPWFFFSDAINIFLVIGGAIAVYITIFIPEATLLSQAQIIRVFQIYGYIVREGEILESVEVSPSSLRTYINDLKKDKEFKELLKKKKLIK